MKFIFGVLVLVWLGTCDRGVTAGCTAFTDWDLVWGGTPPYVYINSLTMQTHPDDIAAICLARHNGNLIPGTGTRFRNPYCAFYDADGVNRITQEHEMVVNQENFGWVLKKSSDPFPFDKAVVTGHENGQKLYTGICNGFKGSDGVVRNWAGKINPNSNYGDRLQLTNGNSWGATCGNYWVLVCFGN